MCKNICFSLFENIYINEETKIMGIGKSEHPYSPKKWPDLWKWSHYDI